MKPILMTVGDRLFLYAIGMLVGIVMGIQIGYWMFGCGVK